MRYSRWRSGRRRGVVLLVGDMLAPGRAGAVVVDLDHREVDSGWHATRDSWRHGCSSAAGSEDADRRRGDARRVTSGPTRTRSIAGPLAAVARRRVPTHCAAAARRPAGGLAAAMPHDRSRPFRADIEGFRAVAVALVVGFDAGLPRRQRRLRRRRRVVRHLRVRDHRGAHRRARAARIDLVRRLLCPARPPANSSGVAVRHHCERLA